MGMGIKQYANQLRILKACELLTAEPGLKIESVALAVGFKFVADFNRAFKVRTNMTPSHYRDAPLHTEHGEFAQANTVAGVECTNQQTVRRVAGTFDDDCGIRIQSSDPE